MLLASRVARNHTIQRCAILARTLRVCAAARAADDASSAKKAGKRTVVKKNYSELPKTRLGPDGTPVVPLGEWDGGLQRPKEADDFDEGDLIDAIEDEEYEDDVSAEADEHEEQQTLVEDEANEAESLAAEVKKSKGGRKRVAKSATAEPADPADTTKKPKSKSTKTKSSTKKADEDEPKLKLSAGVLDNLAKFPHCILLTRVGQFYESYFSQAKEVSRLLGIKLTTRKWGNKVVDFCGFPTRHLDKHLKTLVQHHKRFVALSEEFLPPPDRPRKSGDLLFDRRVARIVTPGTLIDESFLNPYENNYLLAISCATPTSENETSDIVGLAWTDVSTGEFFTKTTTYEGLHDEIVRIGPREVVLSQEDKLGELHPVRQATVEERCPTSFFPYIHSKETDIFEFIKKDSSGTDDVTDSIEDQEQISESLLSDPEVGAIGLLTAYMRANLMDFMPSSLSSPRRETSSSRMQIDAHTIKALEIRERITDGGTSGSLVSVVKRTATSSGTRLLSRWLCSPSTSLKEINARQSLVAFFHSRSYIREDLAQSLDGIEDVSRIVQRFLLGRGYSDDLLSVSRTIRTWNAIKERIDFERSMELTARKSVRAEEWASIDALMCRLRDLGPLADLIEKAVRPRSHESDPPDDDTVSSDDETSSGSHAQILAKPGPEYLDKEGENWPIRPNFNDQLEDLHATWKDLLGRRNAMEAQLQQEYGNKRDSKKIKESTLFTPLVQNKTTESYLYRDWAELAVRILETRDAIYAAFKVAFETVRVEVNAHAEEIRLNARIVDELDVTLAFAKLAMEMNFVRPVVSEGTSFTITNGRHPTVELGLLNAGRVFEPNSIAFTPEARLQVVTGPNMAGKSTLLRQCALIAVLAQSGSFVPADAAEIGIVDRVFSRVGARDDLFRDRSTFMVEMLETSDILRRATPNSLVNHPSESARVEIF
ncbi:hypothetical protein WOLCODRAFT_147580 [Wolfiporia cocos MD-104 SS10]|uniref:DNA mismatch repair proteins mutS family domain-containing protein n=1 Tax=Wolfiporia cocos (strain MD-104) TaxID=742152 RepID=A0A2H3JC05_WOLCO|nr:hypothetical protein WOLCODRAFT_147580 [Wolfiporia cocos MD-104 SS10]